MEILDPNVVWVAHFQTEIASDSTIFKLRRFKNTILPRKETHNHGKLKTTAIQQLVHRVIDYFITYSCFH